MYRLYLDEVGNDGLTHVHEDNERFLSLTGVAMRVDYAQGPLTVNLNWIKQEVFAPAFDDPPIILHRVDIMNYRGAFQVLRQDDKRDLFDRAIYRLMDSAEYVVITALIDKQWMMRQTHWAKKHPYHYLMEILVEKYVRFLGREKSIGDIMPESRDAKDKLLAAAYADIRANGTTWVKSAAIASSIPSAKLKFRKKKDNVAGLQLCDLLAHPSHINVRRRMNHAVTPGDFANKVIPLLEGKKYDRNPATGRILGYGIKHLPQ